MSISLDYRARFAVFSRESSYTHSTPGVATAADVTRFQVGIFVRFVTRLKRWLAHKTCANRWNECCSAIICL